MPATLGRLEVPRGGVVEWFKAAVLKTAVRVTAPWVRIPPPPPPATCRCAGWPGLLQAFLPLSGPRIENSRIGLLVLTGIARHDRQSVMQSRCCDDEIGLRKGVAALPAHFDQHPPLQRDVLSDFENALFEHGPQFVGQPFVQLGPPDGAARTARWCRAAAAKPAQLHELRTGRLALDTPVLFDRDDDDLLAAMHRDR
jgi:hypothetical protein